MSVATAGFSQNDVAAHARSLLRGMQRSAAALSATLLGQPPGKESANQFGVLMYHRIAPPVKGHPFPTWNVTPERLHDQLAGLLKRRFQAWPLRKVLECRRRRLPLPKRVFLVTFDDGYENNYTHAFPVLRDLKVPATIFLATGYVGTGEPLPFDDWSSKGHAGVPADTWRALTLEQCREMQSSGLIELAAHTHTHQDFRGRPDAFRDDLRTCVAFLRQHFGLSDTTFAFPYGTKKTGFSGPAMARIAREVPGILCALTTESELARAECDPFDWGRLTAEQSDTAGTLAGKLSGWFTFLRNGVRSLQSILPGRTAVARQETPEPAILPLRLGRFR
jgi:peptidoglycan/xylan/chitin deacetylase (PgdA/CDA1 family)